MTSTPELVNQVYWIPRDRIRPFAGQPRSHFDREKLNGLAASIAKIGQKVPVVVIPVEDDPDHEYELVDGERRWRAAAIAGIPRLKAIIETGTSREEQFESSAVYNFCREEHTYLETMRMLVRIRKAHGYTYRELAERFGKSPQWVYLYLSLEKLDEDVITKYMESSVPEKQRLSLMIATDLAKFPPASQMEHADHIAQKGWRAVQARLYLERMANRVGKNLRGSDFGGRAVFRRITSFLSVVVSRTNALTAIDRREFDKVLQERPVCDSRLLIDDLDESIESLQVMRQAVERSINDRLLRPTSTPTMQPNGVEFAYRNATNPAASAPGPDPSAVSTR